MTHEYNIIIFYYYLICINLIHVPILCILCACVKCTFYCEKLPTAVDKYNCPSTTWSRRRRLYHEERHHYIGVADGIFSFSAPSETDDDGGAIVILLLLQWRVLSNRQRRRPHRRRCRRRQCRRRPHRIGYID